MTLFSRIPTIAHDFFNQLTEEKLDCFHCDDRMRKSKAVPILFDGEIRQVCCHGCAAILASIEKVHLIEEYYQSKT